MRMSADEELISDLDRAGRPKSIDHQYDDGFAVSRSYRESLPDVQNRTGVEIHGDGVPIIEVGISNFHLPLKVLTAQNESIDLEATVTGTVSLGSDRKGVNMSRIIRTFYEFKDRVFTLELLEEILLRYKETLESSRARLTVRFSYPIYQESLRSGLGGYLYYDVDYEGIIDDLDRFRKRMHLDFIYSSVCPNSAELAEHARNIRGKYALPHSQRSKARISVEVRSGALVTIENIRDKCLEALRTEVQSMVKREDEQAFAELNGSYPKFVEDAVRLLHEEFNVDKRIIDFQIACVHLESLHAHDAVAVINKGVSGGFSGSVEDFRRFVC